MAFSTPLRSVAETVGLVRPADSHEGHYTSSLSALARTVRALLIEHGLPTSESSEQAGFCFAIEDRDELSLQYFDPAVDAGSAGCGPGARAAAGALVRCCSALVEGGYPVTLIVSPRTLVMYVRQK